MHPWCCVLPGVKKEHYCQVVKNWDQKTFPCQWRLCAISTECCREDVIKHCLLALLCISEVVLWNIIKTCCKDYVSTSIFYSREGLPMYMYKVMQNGTSGFFIETKEKDRVLVNPSYGHSVQCHCYCCPGDQHGNNLASHWNWFKRCIK